MKKMTALVTLSVLLANTLLTSCQKDVAASKPPVSSAALAGTYKVTAMQLQPAGGQPQDIFTTLDNCQKQSLQVLHANFSYQLQNACDPADHTTSVWALHGTQKITINGLTGDLVSFDGKNLVLGFDNFFGLQGRMMETLTKQ